MMSSCSGEFSVVWIQENVYESMFCFDLKIVNYLIPLEINLHNPNFSHWPLGEQRLAKEPFKLELDGYLQGLRSK